MIVCMYSEPYPALAVMPKENIGYGAAFGFFYGYLRLVLPGKYYCYLTDKCKSCYFTHFVVNLQTNRMSSNVNQVDLLESSVKYKT